MLILTIIVGCSLLLQLLTIFFSLQLVFTTGRKNAWIVLSIGITTMGVRRFITFVHLLLGDAGYVPEMGYEIVGLAGSAIMLCGVV